MKFRIGSLINILTGTFLLVLSANVMAELVTADELVITGDYQIGVDDPVRVTALFNGTFSSVDSVQVLAFINDYYVKGESYQYSFYGDSNNLVNSVSHLNEDPVNLYQHMGLITNFPAVRALFEDGEATFELVMLSGSSDISSILVRVTGVFIPTPDGDINQDTIVNAADVVLAQRIALDLIAPTSAQLQRGDVAPLGAPDGVINTADLLLITGKTLGQSVGF